MVRYCSKCHKTLDEKEFYGTYRTDKYPDGHFDQCKKCLTMHVDNWEPETYLWILEEADVPYIPAEWNKLMMNWAKDKQKVTGTTIIGRYLSKMKLKQYKNFRWKDNAFLEEMEKTKQKQAMQKQGYSAAEIAEALENNAITVPEKPEKPPEEIDMGFMTTTSGPSAEELGLSEADVLYLQLKWGRAYRPEEWVRLEQLYNDMMNSYDIQGAGHEDTLKLVCKTSLKANQLIDINDVEGFQKMSKAYDNLMKSGKFTAAQNKAESGEFVDSVSELVAICETDGFIPRYYTDGPQDHVDKVLLDLQNYTNSLITEETNLGQMIEQAVKQIAEDKEKEAQSDADYATDDDLLENELFSDHSNDYIKDEDYVEFQRFNDELEAEDEMGEQ